MRWRAPHSCLPPPLLTSFPCRCTVRDGRLPMRSQPRPLRSLGCVDVGWRSVRGACLCFASVVALFLVCRGSTRAFWWVLRLVLHPRFTPWRSDTDFTDCPCRPALCSSVLAPSWYALRLASGGSRGTDAFWTASRLSARSWAGGVALLGALACAALVRYPPTVLFHPSQVHGTSRPPAIVVPTPPTWSLCCVDGTWRAVCACMPLYCIFSGPGY